MRPRILAAVVAAAFVGGACSSPTAPLVDSSTPTSSTTRGTLVVSGGQVLTAVGQTTQLSVTDSAGSSITSGVQWQSLSPGVASVSATGLVTGIVPGLATIEALTSTGLGTLRVFIAPPAAANAAPTTLTSCGSMTTGGLYVLAADLPLPTASACVVSQAAASIQLDCRGHMVPGLSLTNVGAASISNCVITRPSTFSGVSGLTVANSSFTAAVTVTNSSNVTISDSSVAASAFLAVQVFGTTNMQFLRDTISDSSTSASAALAFTNGSNNQVVQCTISGTYNGGPLYNGTDDGILDINEVGDTFQGNTIRSFYDTAVEGVDLVANLTIADNTFSNIGVSGIGAYWCTNWTNSTIRNNSVSSSPMLILADYATGLGQCGVSSVSVGFSGNQIVGNRFSNPLPNALGEIGGVEAAGGFARSTGPVPRLVISMGGIVANNLIQGNDFGSSDGPFVNPRAGFVDGGGNVCGPLNPALSNFACAAPPSPSHFTRSR